MKKHLSLLLFLLFSLYAYSQVNSVPSLVSDSLRFLINNYQFQKALEFIEKQNPNRDLLIEKAQCHKALGDYTKSCMVLVDLSNQYPEDIYILNELASSYQIIGNWQSGEQCYDRLIEIDSTNIYFKIKKGDMLFNQSKYLKAIDDYKQIYDEYLIGSVLNKIGRGYEKMNMVDSARLYYRKAWEYDLTDSQTTASYINISLKMKEAPVALDVCETYLEHDSTNKQINHLYAFTYYMMDDYETASSLFEKCVAKGDSSLLVNRSLGFSYYSLGDSLSFGYLNKAYAQDTTNNSVLYALAVVCNDLEKSKEAITYYSKLLDRSIPERGRLYLYYKGLATAYNDDGMYENSISNYQKAVDFGTENQQSLMFIAMAETYDYKLKDEDNALKYYKLYQNNLHNYVDKLKSRVEADPEDIIDAEKRLNALNKLILSMGG